jgi:large subunit GTPase 1
MSATRFWTGAVNSSSTRIRLLFIILCSLEEEMNMVLTPYERNLEVWRQLWRVIERSDIVVQIVDARNPLFFRSNDLENYVKEVDSKKKNLLLVNKADYLSENQR